MFQVKRVYDKPGADDGLRVLVDRLWPRGLEKGRAKIDLWLKDLAPAGELRRWFGHDPQRWPEFERRYREELRAHDDELKNLRQKGRRGRVTLLFGAHDEEHNNAVVLKKVLQR